MDISSYPCKPQDIITAKDEQKSKTLLSYYYEICVIIGFIINLYFKITLFSFKKYYKNYLLVVFLINLISNLIF